jgi:hypothetical protein
MYSTHVHRLPLSRPIERNCDDLRIGPFIASTGIHRGASSSEFTVQSLKEMVMPVYTHRSHSSTRDPRPVAVRSEWWPWAHSMIAGSGVASTPQLPTPVMVVRDRDPRVLERRQ